MLLQYSGNYSELIDNSLFIKMMTLSKKRRGDIVSCSLWKTTTMSLFKHEDSCIQF
jgi:hypothetical protein